MNEWLSPPRGLACLKGAGAVVFVVVVSELVANAVVQVPADPTRGEVAAPPVPNEPRSVAPTSGSALAAARQEPAPASVHPEPAPADPAPTDPAPSAVPVVRPIVKPVRPPPPPDSSRPGLPGKTYK